MVQSPEADRSDGDVGLAFIYRLGQLGRFAARGIKQCCHIDFLYLKVQKYPCASPRTYLSYFVVVSYFYPVFISNLYYFKNS